MTPATIIQQAQADGVRLALSTAGTIKAVGDGEAVNRWLPLIREHKPGILMALQQSANNVPITPEQETAIRAWMVHIEETDEAVVCNYLDSCHDPAALTYFLKRAMVYRMIELI